MNGRVGRMHKKMVGLTGAEEDTLEGDLRDTWGLKSKMSIGDCSGG